MLRNWAAVGGVIQKQVIGSIVPSDNFEKSLFFGCVLDVRLMTPSLDQISVEGPGKNALTVLVSGYPTTQESGTTYRGL